MKMQLKKTDSLYKNFTNSKYIIALKKVMLFSAGFHIVMITIYSLIKLNTEKFNFFDILDLDLFFPKLVEGNFSQMLSVITFVLLYGLIVLGITLRRRKQLH